MPDRYEFTAPDGSRRWCSRELLGAERLTETCGHFRASGDYCGVCCSLRVRSLALLKPKPTGLRWEWDNYENSDVPCWWLLNLPTWTLGKLEPREGEWSAFYLGYDLMDCNNDWVATGSLSTCARALVDAVTDCHKPTDTAPSSRTRTGKSDESRADR